jgi:hypothetical protein
MTTSTPEKKERCPGCGAALQTESREKPGYIPESALARDPLICQRCFRIKNYNEASSVAIDQDEFLKLLGGIAATDSLVIHIVDLFDFEGSIISGLQRFVGHNDVLLVVNKIDLLPKVTNWNRLRNWVERRARENGLRVKEVVLCSARKGFGFERVVEETARLRGNRDVYVVGATNVGKSTLINRLIADYSDLRRELTVSRYPGTTLDEVRIPLDDGRHIIDTPGIVYDFRLTEIIPREFVAALLPEKPLKPLTYQLNEKQTLFFGSLARFDFLEGERQSFTIYISGGVPVHRTKLERADQLYEEHKGKMLSPPDEKGLAALPEWTRHRLRIRRGERKDIFISGLGWIKVNSDSGALVDLFAPRGIRVLLRDSMI